MTIRAKLYAAIALTVLGPLVTIAVALHGQAQLGDRFDEVEERGGYEALARELKFGVTDVTAGRRRSDAARPKRAAAGAAAGR